MKVGQLVRVKPEVWAEWCRRHQEYGPSTTQPITSVMTEGPLAGHVMLAYPFFWWKEEELEDACLE
jgi:hypothetical protein